MRRKIWEVDIDIVGPITIAEPFGFKQEKGFDQDQFYSDIEFHNSGRGICSTVTAYAENCEIAQTAAFVFMGRMIDVLSLDNSLPLALLLTESPNRHTDIAATRRLLEKSDFMTAFKVARRLEAEQPRLLKSIGWYSKGKISINTLDQFLAYWNAIEVAATGYHTQTERTPLGAKNQVFQCFLDHFGEICEWEISERWIDEMHEKRSRIAHGAEETTAEAISTIARLIPQLEDISRKLVYAILTKLYPNDIFNEAFISATF